MGSYRYLAYYIPFLQWIPQYRLSYVRGDLIAALTMASFYIPMSLSYAANLGHLPPINGLYSFVFNPFIYALLGSCPQMVVGPEAAGSLLLGNVVRDSVDKGHSGEVDGVLNARIAGVVTGMAGAVIFIAGITRLGFLDSVLSRPFLRGFISAIGFVILADQLIPEMGLMERAKEVGGVSHGSSVNKLVFLVENVRAAHGLTCAVAFGSFGIIMVCRYVSLLCGHCRGKRLTLPKGGQETIAASTSKRGLCPGSLHRRGTVGSLYLEVSMGYEGSRDTRKRGVQHRFTLSFPLAVRARSYEACKGCYEHFLPHRSPGVFRIFRCCKELRGW